MCYDNYYGVFWFLSKVREELSWTPDSQRSLVIIGDASPHPPSYHLNTLKIDWKEEAKKLYNEMGVRIYSVQCLNYGGSSLMCYNCRFSLYCNCIRR